MSECEVDFTLAKQCVNGGNGAGVEGLGCCQLSSQSGPGYIMSLLSLWFLICKMGEIILFLWGGCEDH